MPQGGGFLLYLKFQPISISNEQAQFLETRKFQIDEIARIFRVPPHMVGDLEKSSFSNIEMQSLEFVIYTLRPWLVRWEQNLARALFSNAEKPKLFCKFNVDGLLRGDYVSRMNGYAVGRQNGWMSANDIRSLEDLDPIPEEQGGDLYLVNGNFCKLQDAGSAYTKGRQSEPQQNEPAEEQPPDPPAPPAEEPDNTRKRKRPAQRKPKGESPHEEVLELGAR